MLAYVIRRMAYGFVTVLGVLALLFFLFFLYATPDEMARRSLGEKAPPPAIHDCVVKHGHGEPVHAHQLAPLSWVNGARDYVLFVGDLAGSQQGPQVLPQGADPAQGASLQQQIHWLLPVYYQVFQPLLALYQAHSKGLVFGFQVPIPKIGRLCDVAIGIDDPGRHLPTL